jgi:hypothetical protein
MSRGRRLLLAICAAAAIGALGVIYIKGYVPGTPPAQARLQADLASAGARPEGRAAGQLEATWYAQAERLDPIFAIEGTDPGKLRQAVALFLDQRDRIAALYPASERQNIKDTLYPSAFLQTLPDLEEARQALLRAPTLQNAKAYHALLVAAIGQYQDGARALAGGLRAIAATTPSLGYLGGTASTTDTASKMEAVAAVAAEQGKKEQARFGCLLGYSARCPTLASLRAARGALLAAPAPLPLPTQDEREADAITKQMLPLYAFYAGTENALAAIPSDCFATSAAYVRAYYLDYGGKTGRKLANANDAYFYSQEERKEKEPGFPAYEALFNAGVKYEYQSMGNLYMCPDSGLDAASTESILGVLDIVRQKKDPTPQEKEIASLPVLQKSDIAPYVAAAAQGGGAQGDALAERYIEGSANFDQALVGAYNDNDFLIQWAQNQAPVAYGFMFGARNYASAMFFLGNPTFAPRRMSMFSDATANPPSVMMLHSYTDEVSRLYTDQELAAQQRTSLSVERALLSKKK